VDGGFRAGRWCWSCRSGVPSRDGTAGPGRPVWSTTPKRKGRSVERPLECRGRLVWRTRRVWGWSASVVAPGVPVGGALARADHVRMDVDARPRANPPLGPARPGQSGAWSADGRADGTRSRNSGLPREAEGESCTCQPPFPPIVSNSTMHRYVTQGTGEHTVTLGGPTIRVAEFRCSAGSGNPRPILRAGSRTINVFPPPRRPAAPGSVSPLPACSCCPKSAAPSRGGRSGR